MIYRINIQLEEDDRAEKYEVTITRECPDAEVHSELMDVVAVAAERVIRSLPDVEPFRQVG